MMIGVSNHLLNIVFRFHYHSQEVIGSLGNIFDGFATSTDQNPPGSKDPRFPGKVVVMVVFAMLKGTRIKCSQAMLTLDIQGHLLRFFGYVL